MTGLLRRIDLLFIPVATLFAHFRYSWRGFNPTDDGFVLASSRRLLEGQIPHLDFISIRPVGSALLHMPFVAWGGENTFWFSRFFVWFQFACMAWAWVRVADLAANGSFKNSLLKILLASAAFAFSSHAFPAMAWNTIDGLFFASLGIYLCFRGKTSVRWAGYVLIGLASLCKQSFVPVGLAIFVLGDWRKLICWLALLLPGGTYLAYLFSMGALGEGFVQMGSYYDFWDQGIMRYLSAWTVPWGMGWGYLAMTLMNKQKRASTDRFKNVNILLGLCMFAGLFAVISFHLTKRSVVFFDAMFGAAAGSVVYFWQEDELRRENMRVGILALLAAWCASLSKGYATPALASGALAAVLGGYAALAYESFDRGSRFRKMAVFLALVVLVLTGVNYEKVRSRAVYRDRPIEMLKFPLGEVLDGGNRIRANRNTYEFLADLKAAVAKAGGKKYAILPDCAAHWVRSRGPNPLKMDWMQNIELKNPAVVRRIQEDLEAQRGRVTFLVNKIKTFVLAGKFVPVRDDDRYAAERFVRANFTKVGETRFFDLYR